MKYLISFFLLCWFAFSSFTKIHPYHVGSVEFNYNVESKTFQVTGKFFLDDLENGLKRKYGEKLHFQDRSIEKQMDAALKKYMHEYLKLRVDGTFSELKYLGYEEDRESVLIYLESAPVPQPRKVEAAVSVLYNYFEDQQNIVHLIVNGQRQSTKLSYPDRYIFRNF